MGVLEGSGESRSLKGVKLGVSIGRTRVYDGGLERGVRGTLIVMVTGPSGLVVHGTFTRNGGDP